MKDILTLRGAIDLLVSNKGSVSGPILSNAGTNPREFIDATSELDCIDGLKVRSINGNGQVFCGGCPHIGSCPVPSTLVPDSKRVLDRSRYGDRQRGNVNKDFNKQAPLNQPGTFDGADPKQIWYRRDGT